jgi:tetratricopeptide (TPR) repeat protein
MDFIVAPGFRGSFEDYLNRGQAYLVLGRHNRALRILDEAVRIKPDSYKALCARAEALHRLGDMQGAIRDYQAAHCLEPEADAPLTGVALTLLESDRDDDAIAELEKVLARHPANLEAKLLKARALSAQKDLGAALTLIEQVLASAPEHAVAHEYRGRILWMKGALQDAAQSFNRSLHVDPFRLSTHLALSALWTAEGNNAAADAQYVRVQQLFKRNPEALNEIAAHMAEHGHASKAIEIFSDLAEMEPASRSTMLVNMGNAYLRLNNVSFALKSFQDALKVDPNNVLAFRRLGDFEDEHGTAEKAAENFTRACELDPDNSSHHACAGTAYLRLQEYERATSYLRKSLEIFPNQPQMHYNLAAALVFQGLGEEAVDELAKAVRLDPLYVRAWYLKAQIELQLCRVDDATISVRHALSSPSSLTPEEVRVIHAFAQENKLTT